MGQYRNIVSILEMTLGLCTNASSPCLEMAIELPPSSEMRIEEGSSILSTRSAKQWAQTGNCARVITASILLVKLNQSANLNPPPSF